MSISINVGTSFIWFLTQYYVINTYINNNSITQTSHSIYTPNDIEVVVHAVLTKKTTEGRTIRIVVHSY